MRKTESRMGGTELSQHDNSHLQKTGMCPRMPHLREAYCQRPAFPSFIRPRM